MSEPKLTRRQQAALYLQDPNVRRYLDLLSYTEGTQKHGYYTKFGGDRIDDLTRHPNKIWGRTGDGATSATGRYQFLTGTWNEQAKLLGLKDFGPESQDLAAVSLIMRRGAINDILNGDIDSANRKLSNEWASLPYNKSPHQHQKSAEAVAQEWERLGGKEYMIPSQQYDYSTAPLIPTTEDQPTQPIEPLYTEPSLPEPETAQPSVVPPPQIGFQQMKPIDFAITASEPETMLEEPEPPNYQEGLAKAFGIMPKANNGLGDYVGELVKSIYDQT